MTPCQLAGCVYFASRRKKRDAAQALVVSALGNSGDGKTLKKTLKEWSDDK